MSYHTLAVTYSTLLKTKVSACQTKPPVTVFVLPNKYAHIRDIVTRKACRVMTRVPVSSPFYPKSCGGSHIPPPELSRAYVSSVVSSLLHGDLLHTR